MFCFHHFRVFTRCCFQNVLVIVPFSKSIVFKTCRLKMCRFRVKGRPIRHIFHRFQNVPASCEHCLRHPMFWMIFTKSGFGFLNKILKFLMKMLGKSQSGDESYYYSEGGKSVPPISSMLKKNRIVFGFCFLCINESLDILIHCGFQGKELLL